MEHWELLNSQSAASFLHISSAILNDEIWSTKDYIESPIDIINLRENISNVIVSTVAADVLVPLGARSSAGTAMTISGSGIDKGPVLNSSPQGQNGRHFADDSFKGIFMNEKFFFSIQISLKFVPKGLIDNKAALVQVMAWRRTGDKPLPEPILTQFTDVYMRH